MWDFKLRCFDQLTCAEKIVRNIIESDQNTRRYNELLAREAFLGKQYRRISKKSIVALEKWEKALDNVYKGLPDLAENVEKRELKTRCKYELIDERLTEIARERDEISIEVKELEDQWEYITERKI